MVPRQPRDLYTTLQPCLMCAASAVFLHVERVFYAAVDEYFDGLDDLWDHHPYSRRWKPIEIGAMSGRLSSLARLLPLTVQVVEAPDSPVMALAHERTPEVAALAVEVAADQTLQRIRDGEGLILDALTELWSRLPG